MMSVIYAQFKPLPDSWYTPERIELYRTLIKNAEVFDKEAGQPDCAMPEKDEFGRHLEDLEADLICDYRGADCD